MIRDRWYTDDRPDGYQGDRCACCGAPWQHGSGQDDCQAATICDRCVDRSSFDAATANTVWQAWQDEQEAEIVRLRAQVERLQAALKNITQGEPMTR